MTKEEKREYDKVRYLENKEKLKAQSKAWRDANKEKTAAIGKSYRAKNKEKVNAKNKAWRDRNKEEIATYSKAYHKSTKTDYTVVYLLTNEHYVGVTNNLAQRLKKHKTIGRDTSDYRILAKVDNRKDALELEDLLHQEGYNGAFGWENKKK